MQMLNGHARGPGRPAAGPVVVVAIALVMIADLGAGRVSVDALLPARAGSTHASSRPAADAAVRTRGSGARAATVVPATTPSTVRAPRGWSAERGIVPGERGRGDDVRSRAAPGCRNTGRASDDPTQACAEAVQATVAIAVLGCVDRQSAHR